MRKSRPINVVQDENKIVPADVLAKAIVDIGSSMRRLSSTALNRKAIITLIADDVKLGKGTIDSVLKSLEWLENTYLKPKKASK